MDYAEFIARVLKDNSVNSVAKRLGIPQKSLDRYSKAEQLPGWRAAKLMAKEAGVGLEEVFELLATEEQNRKSIMVYNADRADVAQSVEQLIRNQ